MWLEAVALRVLGTLIFAYIKQPAGNVLLLESVHAGSKSLCGLTSACHVQCSFQPPALLGVHLFSVSSASGCTRLPDACSSIQWASLLYQASHFCVSQASGCARPPASCISVVWTFQSVRAFRSCCNESFGDIHIWVHTEQTCFPRRCSDRLYLFICFTAFSSPAYPWSERPTCCVPSSSRHVKAGRLVRRLSVSEIDRPHCMSI